MNSACYSVFVVVANEQHFSSIIEIIFLADIFDFDCCAVLGIEIALYVHSGSGWLFGFLGG